MPLLFPAAGSRELGRGCRRLNAAPTDGVVAGGAAGKTNGHVLLVSGGTPNVGPAAIPSHLLSGTQKEARQEAATAFFTELGGTAAANNVVVDVLCVGSDQFGFSSVGPVVQVGLSTSSHSRTRLLLPPSSSPASPSSTTAFAATALALSLHHSLLSRAAVLCAGGCPCPERVVAAEMSRRF